MPALLPTPCSALVGPAARAAEESSSSPSDTVSIQRRPELTRHLYPTSAEPTVAGERVRGTPSFLFCATNYKQG
jgi:hypothetical protein